MRSIFLLSFFIISFFNAQIKEERQVGNFTKLITSNSVTVIYKQVSSGQSLTVEWDEDLMKYLKTEVKNNVLRIFIENDNFFRSINTNKLRIYVTNPGISSIEASSSSDVTIQGDLNVKTLNIKASSSASIVGRTTNNVLNIDCSSSSNVSMECKADDVNVEASSSSDVILKGTATKLNIDASSSSDVVSRELIVDDADVQASSSADVIVYAKENLKASASSSGEIVFYGKPKNIMKNEKSSGNVIQK